MGSKRRRVEMLERNSGMVHVRCAECGQRFLTSKQDLAEHWARAWELSHEHPALSEAYAAGEKEAMAAYVNEHHAELLSQIPPAIALIEEHQHPGDIINEATGKRLVSEGVDAWRGKGDDGAIYKLKRERVRMYLNELEARRRRMVHGDG